MTCHNPDFCSSFVPPHTPEDDAPWPEKFDRLFGAGQGGGNGQPEHPKVGGSVAGFVAVVSAMVAAALLVIDQLPLVIVGL